VTTAAIGQPFKSARSRVRLVFQVSVAMLIICAGALFMLGVALLTGFRLRRLYSERIAAAIGKLVLRVFGVRFTVHGPRRLPEGQVVYISNHTSTIDLFVLVTLGLPNARYFLSGYLRKCLPLGLIGYVIGIFWTVPQAFPQRRREIFARAAKILKRTGDSVYLSPEGERITSGRIGKFNKGAFHLAADLHAPIVPLFLWIPRSMDPGKGLDARPGTLQVHIGSPVDTRTWRIDEVERYRDEMHAFYERWHAQLNAPSARPL
jgi:putative phosphoserine phosphatase/1-acylglycerol-3-phosphate O-acyltransferase